MFPLFTKSRLREEFFALTEKVGHRQISPFQRRALPFIFGSRDLAIETPVDEDLTAALALAAYYEGKVQSGGNLSVLLSDNPDLIKKLVKQLRVFASKSGSAARAVALGIDENIKKELQLLSRPPDIIVGTPERLIDHIRRENLTIDGVDRVVIALPNNYSEAGFDKDVLFIYSKLAKHPQTILFSSSMSDGIPLSSILRRPLTLSKEESARAGAPPDPPIVYRVKDETGKSQLLGDLFFAEEVFDSAVVCGSRETAERLVSELESLGITAKQLSVNPSVGERSDRQAELHAGRIRAVVTESLVSLAQVRDLKTLIIYEKPFDAHDYAELKSLTAGLVPCSPLISIVAESEPNIFEGIQEVQYVDTNNRPSSEDILKGKIHTIVKRIKEEEDPDELNKLRKIVRRNVPIFLRGYFMAYLLKESSGRQSVAQDMKTLFVSVGKNRRVFPRDLLRLFSGALEIKANSIGNIKVLDNYSFIDVPEGLAEKAISALDGKDFRGRKITVNHARKKEEE